MVRSELRPWPIDVQNKALSKNNTSLYKFKNAVVHLINKARD